MVLGFVEFIISAFCILTFLETIFLYAFTGLNLSIFNPIRNYNRWSKLNWFGVIVITVILNVICFQFAIVYWLYKIIQLICNIITLLFTVGRK